MKPETLHNHQTREALERELRELGKKIKGKSCQCPVHDDEHPSASMFAGEDGGWRVKCFSCGFCGDVFDIRAKLQGRDVGELLREASGATSKKDGGNAKPKRVFASVDEIRNSVSSLGPVEAIYTYSNPDSGSAEIVQVRYWCEEDQRKKFLVHRGVEGGFVLGAPPKPWPIYNRARVKNSETVVLVEGEKCVHALHAIGVIATTSLSGSGNADKADWSPVAGKTVYCWRDNDEQGEKYITAAIARMSELSPRPKIYSLDVTTLGLDEGGDVADFLARPGAADDFWDVLRDGSEAVGAGAELDSRIEQLISGKWSSIRWPWPCLSRLAKALFPSTITVFCGDPSVAKSFFILQAAEWWNSRGTKVALLEMELGIETHMMRLLAMLSNRWDLMDDDWCRENGTELRKLREEHRVALDAFRPCLSDRLPGRCTYQSILAWMKEKCAAGAEIIVLDPVTAVDAGESRYSEDHKFISDATEVIREYGARLILVTHPRGGAKGKQTQDDIAGGRAFSRHTQAVLWLMAQDPSKPLLCRTEMGQAQIECNRTVFIAKTSYGKGNRLRLGFVFGNDVRFAEQGIVMKNKDEVVP